MRKYGRLRNVAKIDWNMLGEKFSKDRCKPGCEFHKKMQLEIPSSFILAKKTSFVHPSTPPSPKKNRHAKILSGTEPLGFHKKIDSLDFV